MAKAGPRRSTASAEELRRELLDATVRVLARDGFAHASARAIAAEAGTVNGSIYYHFGSMDGLLGATVQDLADRGIARISAGVGGDGAVHEWPDRLGAVLRAEVASDDGRAMLELLVGARTSEALADDVRAAVDRAIDYATEQLAAVLGDAPVVQVVPVELMAELAGATFLGIEVLAQNGRELDVDRLVAVVAVLVGIVTGIAPPPP
ncbi:MAG: TetR/AcrR family transcriptional regulator [Actinobacteria bacterium]|nr:TetR/AcrR family transcriptional regulator [Actinomycetota bacterium]